MEDLATASPITPRHLALSAAPAFDDVPFPSDALLARYNVAGPRYTSYPTVPEWSTEFGPEAYAAHLERADASAPFSLYVHLPFCHSLCWYCGCNVLISKRGSDADVYLDHLERELDLVVERVGRGRSLTQIHWGGGTPTFLDERQIERLWSAIAARFQVRPDAEVAIEVHPAKTTGSQLDTLRRLGFNRISMGLQDFDPTVQKATNRIQTPEQTEALLDHARGLGFTGVNFDLIYGLPFQTEASWARTLEQVLAMSPDRLAVYSFAFIPDVLKHQRRMDETALPTTRTKLELFRAAYRGFVGNGYRAIGMDHFAKEGDELSRAQDRRALGRNFQGYTVNWAAQTIAVGSTGISDVGGAFAQNVRALPRYYERIRSGRFATERGLSLSSDDVRRRAIIQSVMCNFWIDLEPDGAETFSRELSALEPLERDGLLERRGSEISVTRLGRLFVRNVAMAFDAYLGRPATPKFSRTV